MPALIDITGQVFGRLRAIGRISGQFWAFECECGAAVTAKSQTVREGGTRSCGCLRRELAALRATTHGMRHHPLYYTWMNMQARTTNPNNPKFKIYGAVGRDLCEEWLDVRVFITYVEETLGSKPNGDYTIDRIDNQKGYEPGNIRWATRDEQRANQGCSSCGGLDHDVRTCL